MPMTLAQVAELLGGELTGDPGLEVFRPGAVGEAGPGELVVAFDAAALESAERGPAAAVVRPRNLSCGKPSIGVDDPRVALEKLLFAFEPSAPPPTGVHPTAVIDPTARLGADPSVGPYVVLGAGVVLGDRCRIGAGCCLGEQVVLGDDVELHPHVTIYQRCTLGSRVEVHAGAVIGADGFGYRSSAQGHQRIPHLGTVVIEDDVELGANATVDRAKVGATRIGAGSKIDNLVVVGHNCRVGRACLLVAQVGLAGSVELGDGVVLAGQVGVADHVKIGAGAMLGGQAGVMREVPPGQRQLGSPALHQVEFFKQQAALRRLRQLFVRVQSLEMAAGIDAHDDDA